MLMDNIAQKRSLASQSEIGRCVQKERKEVRGDSQWILGQVSEHDYMHARVKFYVHSELRFLRRSLSLHIIYRVFSCYTAHGRIM